MRKFVRWGLEKAKFYPCISVAGRTIDFTPQGISMCKAFTYYQGFPKVKWEDIKACEATYILSKVRKEVDKFDFILPSYLERCLRCIALPICGGCCPLDGKVLTKNKIVCVNERFCNFMKSLAFNIMELYFCRFYSNLISIEKANESDVERLVKLLKNKKLNKVLQNLYYSTKLLSIKFRLETIGYLIINKEISKRFAVLLKGITGKDRVRIIRKIRKYGIPKKNIIEVSRKFDI